MKRKPEAVFINVPFDRRYLKLFHALVLPCTSAVLFLDAP